METIANGELFRAQSFELACAQNDFEHRPTQPMHLWTNGRIASSGMPTVKRYHHASHDQLRQRLDDFVAACNFGRRLKTLRGLTPYDAICKAWQDEPARFTSSRRASP